MSKLIPLSVTVDPWVANYFVQFSYFQMNPVWRPGNEYILACKETISAIPPETEDDRITTIVYSLICDKAENLKSPDTVEAEQFDEITPFKCEFDIYYSLGNSIKTGEVELTDQAAKEVAIRSRIHLADLIFSLGGSLARHMFIEVIRNHRIT